MTQIFQTQIKHICLIVQYAKSTVLAVSKNSDPKRFFKKKVIFFQQGLLCSVQVITAAELIQEKNTVGCPCAHWLNRGTCELHKKTNKQKPITCEASLCC